MFVKQAENAPRHFIHYLPRRVSMRASHDTGTDFVREQGPSAGLLAPRFHGTRAKHGATQRVRCGDTIWIVSQLSSPWGKLPPAIDAKICVAAVKESADGFIFEAGPGSAWLPLTDSTWLLRGLVTISRYTGPNGKALWDNERQSPIGWHIQTMRELLDPAALMNWETRMRSRKVYFVSYKICDGTRDAFEVVRHLVQHGCAVFWDRWSLPRRLGERGEHILDDLLRDYLGAKIDESARVYGIESVRYFDEHGHARHEHALAVQMGKYVSSTNMRG